VVQVAVVRKTGRHSSRFFYLHGVIMASSWRHLGVILRWLHSRNTSKGK
jgi:hypothetical protein